MKRLVLIDSNAIIHRAYHALPKNMSTKKGELTNAVYGFTTTLIKVLKDLKPDYIAASFDVSGPTFRHEKYQEYKATRVKADQELYDQIPRIKELLNVMSIPIYEKEGFEADDVIGTIIADAENKSKDANDKLEIYVVSGDKDIFQLVNGGVKIYNLKRGLSDIQIVDKAVIKKDYNLEPEDFIDLKALAGDPSDNIPGVPGIGLKTASDLIVKFDTLIKLYDEIENLNRKMKSEDENEDIRQKIASKLKIKERILHLLIENKEQAFLSQKLATIHKDVPIKFSLEDMKWGEYDRGKLRSYFEKLGFKSILNRLIENGKIEKKSESKKEDEQLKLL